jgi:hypothetical protein
MCHYERSYGTTTEQKIFQPVQPLNTALNNNNTIPKSMQ